MPLDLLQRYPLPIPHREDLLDGDDIDELAASVTLSAEGFELLLGEFGEVGAGGEDTDCGVGSWRRGCGCGGAGGGGWG